jgi:hypothetical protein
MPVSHPLVQIWVYIISHGPRAMTHGFLLVSSKKWVTNRFLGGPMVSSINRKSLEPKTTLSI